MIRVSKLTDYAALLLSIMAKAPTVTYQVSELSNKSNISRPTVSKIMKLLNNTGILISKRGISGGYQLGYLPHQIKLTDIIQAIEGNLSITECSKSAIEDITCSLASTCPTQRPWSNINQTIISALEKFTLNDLQSGAEVSE